jgi:O-antigen/teichoic acid export membrane protein
MSSNSPTATRAGVTSPEQQRLVGAGAVVAIGLVAELGAQFARTALLARWLGATEFGLVVSISTLAALVEMLSFIGIDRYLVYSTDGGSRQALGVAHALGLLRGAVSVAIVAILAWPTAAVMGESSYAFSFVVIALGPLLRGASHLGVVQMQRSGRFWPAAASNAGGAVIGLMAAAVAAVIAPDYRTILWGLSAQAAGSLFLSHLFAYGVPFAICFDRTRLREVLRFGLPLLVNGFALAAAFQLDRMAVGAWLGVSALGIYGISITLLFQPVALLARLATAILQPPMSVAWHADRSTAFPSWVRQLARYSGVFGGASAAVTVCLGAPTLRLVFGPSFSTSDLFFVLMAGAVLARLQRYALNLIGLAMGRTSDMMMSNIGGAIALPVMIGSFYINHDLISAGFGTLLGELLAIVIIEAKLSRRCGSAAYAMREGMAFAALLPFTLSAWVLLSDPPLWLRTAVAAIALIAPASMLITGCAPWRSMLLRFRNRAI